MRKIRDKNNKFIAKDLVFGYPKLLLFDHFDFQIDKSLAVIQGFSGCGKTTLLKLFAGILSPSSFEILPPTNNRSLILQEDGLFPWLTAEKNISMFFSNYNLMNDSDPLVSEISKFIKKKVYTLSFGQRRMVEMLRVMLFKPSILYLDEPFNFLDNYRAEVIWDKICHLSNEGTFVIVSTHETRGLNLHKHAEVFRFHGVPPWRNLEKA